MSDTNLLEELLLTALRRLPTPNRYLIAYSGGLDSTVLLHALARRSSELAAPLAAIHVHHGLQVPAEHWLKHCLNQCDARGIHCDTVRVNVETVSGKGIEAAARHARYQAIAEVMVDGDMVLTAHHQDDQAETLLLQLFRGSGVAGVAAMAPIKPFAKGWHVRPLLDVTRAQLQAYAESMALQWIDDPSNFDTSLRRNQLRHEIMPQLHSCYPALRATLSRSARHFAEASELLNDLAGHDLQVHGGCQEGTLSVKGLLSITPARRHNLLRYWIRAAGFLPPDSNRLQQICDEVLHASIDAMPQVAWLGAELRRYRDDLYVMAPLSPVPVSTLSWDFSTPLVLPTGRGTLVARQVAGEGLAATRLAGLTVEVRFRRGGEHCRPTERRENHELKKLLQEAAIPPWERERLPLLYVGGKLAQVGGLWCCEPFAAKPGESGIVIDWLPTTIENRSKNNDN